MKKGHDFEMLKNSEIKYEIIHGNYEKKFGKIIFYKHFEIKVKIKPGLKKALILNLQARPAIGLVLGFLGYRHQVIPLLQKLCHATRAYIINANGLPGFVFVM